MQVAESPPRAKASGHGNTGIATAEKARLFEAAAELAKLRTGLHAREQEKALLEMQLQQQDFTVKKMSLDLSRHKLELHKETDTTLAAKDKQIVQLQERLQQNEAAVLQLYAALQQQQDPAVKGLAKQEQNKFKQLDPEVLAKIRGSFSMGMSSRHDLVGRSHSAPKQSAAAAAAASFTTHLNKAAGQVNKPCLNWQETFHMHSSR